MRRSLLPSSQTTPDTISHVGCGNTAAPDTRGATAETCSDTGQDRRGERVPPPVPPLLIEYDLDMAAGRIERRAAPPQVAAPERLRSSLYVLGLLGCCAAISRSPLTVPALNHRMTRLG